MSGRIGIIIIVGTRHNSKVMGFITELVQGSKYRNFMKYLYGWGASVVLVGALFKLQHWPGAGVMLTIGMTTEAIIFFFSAFEPVVEEVDWSLVYPELAGITDSGDSHSGRNSGGGTSMDPAMLEGVITSAIAKSPLASGIVVKGGAPGAPAVAAASTGGNAGMVFTEKFNEMLEKAQIGPELFSRVGAGLSKLSEASMGIAKISSAVAATEVFSGNLQRAGNAVGHFAESYENSGSLLSRSAQVISASLEGTSKGIEQVSQHLASGMQDVIGRMGAGVKATEASIQSLNQNIAALNTVHELQIKDAQARMSQSQTVTKGVEELMQRLSATVVDTQRYGQSVAQLTENVAKLNAIYGNMLSAMGSIMSGK